MFHQRGLQARLSIWGYILYSSETKSFTGPYNRLLSAYIIMSSKLTVKKLYFTFRIKGIKVDYNWEITIFMDMLHSPWHQTLGCYSFILIIFKCRLNQIQNMPTCDHSRLLQLMVSLLTLLSEFLKGKIYRSHWLFQKKFIVLKKYFTA